MLASQKSGPRDDAGRTGTKGGGGSEDEKACRVVVFIGRSETFIVVPAGMVGALCRDMERCYPQPHAPPQPDIKMDETVLHMRCEH